MPQRKTNFVRAMLAMLGTVIGAGVFALPATFQETGVVPGSIGFWCAALVVVATHLFYAELVLRTKQASAHRLPVQAGALLGPWARRLAYLTHPAQIIGASLVYMILGGTFLFLILQAVGFTVSLLAAQLCFWAIGAAVVWRGLDVVSTIESKVSSLLVGLLLVASCFFLFKLDPVLLEASRWQTVPGSLGIFLFALFGWEVIPEIVQLTSRNAAKTRAAVALGSLSAALLMWLFGILAYLALGHGVFVDVNQLVFGFPQALFWVVPVIGFLAVVSPYLTLTQDLVATFTSDARMTKRTAWLITFIAPLLLFSVTSHDFLTTVGFMGSFFACINGTLICLMFLVVAIQKKAFWHWRVLVPCVCGVFFLSLFIRQVSLLVR